MTKLEADDTKMRRDIVTYDSYFTEHANLIEVIPDIL